MQGGWERRSQFASAAADPAGGAVSAAEFRGRPRRAVRTGCAARRRGGRRVLSRGFQSYVNRPPSDESVPPGRTTQTRPYGGRHGHGTHNTAREFCARPVGPTDPGAGGGTRRDDGTNRRSQCRRSRRTDVVSEPVPHLEPLPGVDPACRGARLRCGAEPAHRRVRCRVRLAGHGSDGRACAIGVAIGRQRWNSWDLVNRPDEVVSATLGWWPTRSPSVQSTGSGSPSRLPGLRLPHDGVMRPSASRVLEAPGPAKGRM